jgi:DNA (cytosine-5)-methyltransferase 1
MIPTMPKLRVMDLFAGCGGLTQGFADSKRYTPVAAVEFDHQAAATYAQNFGSHVYVGDIAEWVQSSMPAADVVVGGPPCQGFSALGKQDPADPRNLMWRHYVATLQRVRPAFFVLENVPQFLRSSEFAAFEAETRRGGVLAQYELEPFVLNSANYGVPQSRRRAVVIGRRRELDPVGPPPETTPLGLQEAFPSWLSPHVSDTDLPASTIEFEGRTLPGAFKITDLHITRRPSDISRARFRAIPPGGNRTDLPDHLLTPCWRKHTSGSGDVMGRLSWDKPSVTIRTEFFKPEKGRYLHPDEHRPITHAEAAFIQGFPETFLWCGNKSSIARQIGNAVPPPLAKAIGGHIAQHLC